MYFRTYIGVGSNLKDPQRQVQTAIAALDTMPGVRQSRASRLHVSKPMGPTDQDDYVNAVVKLETTLTPLALLDQLQALEQQHDRQRGRRWGERTLDLDIILYSDIAMEHPRLTIPHPELYERDFVLLPLAEIAPELVLPNGQCIGDAILKLGQRYVFQLVDL